MCRKGRMVCQDSVCLIATFLCVVVGPEYFLHFQSPSDGWGLGTEGAMYMYTA